MSASGKIQGGPLVLFIVFWLLYQFTAPAQYTYDGLSYALDVEFGSPVQLFHANHLLYNAFARAAYRFFQALGYSGRAIYLMQSVNALTAAAAVAGMAWIVSRRFGWIRGCLVAALFGVSRVFWSEAADPGCYALAGLAVCASLELLLRADQVQPLLVGAAHGGLALFHQMIALAAPAYWLRLSSVRAKALYSAGFALGAGVPYALVAGLFHNRSIGEALYWALGPGGPRSGTPILSDAWWSLDLKRNVVRAWQGFADSLVADAPLLQAALAVGVIALVVWAARSWRAFKNEPYRALWAWIAVMNVFQFFFYPGALRYRLLFLPPLLYLAAAATQGWRHPRWMWAGAVIVLGLGAITYQTAIHPRRLAGPEALRTAWVRERVGTADFLLFDGRDTRSIPNVYLAYFGNVPARSLSGYLFANPLGDWSSLSRQIRSAHRAGGRIYVEGVLFEKTRQRAIEREQGVSEGTVTDWIAGLEPKAVVPGPGDYFLIEAIPRVQAK